MKLPGHSDTKHTQAIQAQYISMSHYEFRNGQMNMNKEWLPIPGLDLWDPRS